jgi:radical SAM superfamily enzyme
MERTELLFAHWAVRALKDARGPKWKKLVEDVAALPETHPDALAFQLMMVRLNGCVTCDARKYIERGGCARCSSTTLAFSKETEENLLARYRAARKEITSTLKTEKRAVAKAA